MCCKALHLAYRISGSRKDYPLVSKIASTLHRTITLIRLRAGVVAHLMTTVSPADSVSFFFCRYDEIESMRARTIVGNIARQLLDGLPLESFAKVDQAMDTLSLDTDQIVDLLQKVLPETRRYFVMIDGLDECEEEEAKELISTIRNLLTLQRITFKIFCSSRPDVFRWVPTILKPEWHVSMAVRDVNPDIERYIDAALEQRIENGDLQLGDPTLILTIQDTLLSGAQGMYVLLRSGLEPYTSCLLWLGFCGLLSRSKLYVDKEAIRASSRLFTLFRRTYQRLSIVFLADLLRWRT